MQEILCAFNWNDKLTLTQNIRFKFHRDSDKKYIFLLCLTIFSENNIYIAVKKYFVFVDMNIFERIRILFNLFKK